MDRLLHLCRRRFFFLREERMGRNMILPDWRAGIRGVWNGTVKKEEWGRFISMKKRGKTAANHSVCVSLYRIKERI